jgi:hypothetical protein
MIKNFKVNTNGQGIQQKILLKTFFYVFYIYFQNIMT